MANRWGNNGNGDRLYFPGLQNHCKCWLQLWNSNTLAPWKKRYHKPRRVLKSRESTLPTKVHLLKAMVFPVVMYGCESWTIKKAERWRIDAFKLWCWRLLRVPWTAGRSNQKILKDISPKYLLEGLMLKLKLQYFGHLMQRTDSLENTLMLGDWVQEEKGTTEDEMVGWHHQLNVHEFEQPPGDGEGQGSLGCCSPWGHKESDMTDGTTPPVCEYQALGTMPSSLIFPTMLGVVVPNSWSWRLVPTLELPARHQAARRLLVLRGLCLRLAQSRHFGKAGLMSPPEGQTTHSSTPGIPHWCRARGPGLLPSLLCFRGWLCFSGNIFLRGLREDETHNLGWDLATHVPQCRMSPLLIPRAAPIAAVLVPGVCLAPCANCGHPEPAPSADPLLPSLCRCCMRSCQVTGLTGACVLMPLCWHLLPLLPSRQLR